MEIHSPKVNAFTINFFKGMFGGFIKKLKSSIWNIWIKIIFIYYFKLILPILTH